MARIPPQRRDGSLLHTVVCQARADGALVMLIAVQLFVLGLYLPPVLTNPEGPAPPQITIWVPVHTAEWPDRPVGALVVLVVVQLSGLDCISRQC